MASDDKPEPLTDLERELTRIIVGLCSGSLRIDSPPPEGRVAYPSSAHRGSIVVAISHLGIEQIDRFSVARVVDANPQHMLFDPVSDRSEVPVGVVQVRELAGDGLCNYRNQAFAAIVPKDAPRVIL